MIQANTNKIEILNDNYNDKMELKSGVNYKGTSVLKHSFNI